jgi:type I restriction enzyme, S subunit
MNNAENNNDLKTLPEGWTAGELGDLCDLNRSTLNPPFHGAEEYVGLEHIDSGKFFLSRFGTPDEVRSTKNGFEPGFILYGKLRPYLDKAVVAQTSGICSTDVLVFTAKNEVPPEFVVSVLHTDMFVEHAKKTTHGVNHPRTSWKSIKEYSLAIPPVNEQQKIAAVLLKLQKAILIQERTLETLRELKKATLQRIFTRGLHGKSQSTDLGEIPEGWGWKPLEEVLNDSTYGLSVRGQSAGQYPILRMNCQISGRVVFNDLQFVDLDRRAFDKFCLKDGDLLFNRTNSYELVGRMAVYHSNRETVFASYLIRLRLDRDQANSDFVNYYFFMDSAQSRLKTLASRGVSQSNINASKLKQFQVPFPETVDEQKRIAAIFRTLDKKIGVHERKRDTLNELFRTTLNQLMTARIRVNNLKIDTSEVEG